MSPQSATARATTSVKSEASYRSPPSTVSDVSQHDAEDRRGRRQQWERSSTAKAEDDSAGDKQVGNDDSNGKPRKRKRSRKGLEKSFACSQPGCGKSYSRAEHLYRHQLNHAPKKIYHCDHPGCERTFVRQDLRTRHQERHTARGSHLQRKDYPMQSSDLNPTPPIGHGGQHEHAAHEIDHGIGQSPLNGRMSESYQPMSKDVTSSGSHQLPSPQASKIMATSEYGPGISSLKRTLSDEHSYANPHGVLGSSTIRNTSVSEYESSQKHSGFPPQRGALHKGMGSDMYRFHPGIGLINTSDSYRPSSASSYNGVTSQSSITPGPARNGLGEDTLGPQHGFPTMMSLPSPFYPSTQPSLQDAHGSYTNVPNAATAMGPSTAFDNYNGSGLDPSSIDANSASYQPPYWISDGYSHSPRTTTEDFVHYLFNEASYPQSSPGGTRQGSMSFGTTTFMEEHDNFSRGLYALNQELGNGYGAQSTPQQHPMALNNILDPVSLHAIISDEKRREILDLIETRFTDTAPVSPQKDALLKGDRDADGHVLSLRSMQLYIRSYWYHFHPQMPILHKPTFSADKAQDLLLLAVIAIGASCLDKMHGVDITKAGAELSNLLAWHLRGEIFKHPDFLPPAKLWIFQTLVLLEVYEKMYSTRTLHERAHIHHGTTLTLMRRGSSLIGRSPLDSPAGPKTEHTGISANPDTSRSTSSTPEQWWNHWITNEATRRVAFAAYIIDSIHATMFGHQATMVAHEMKLALPCDEQLWSANSGAEVAKIEASLRADGVPNMTFFEGLKNTLKGKAVRTNPFGRTAIMAGLLSVTWHMNQRDVQIHHLGALKALGGKDVWRGPLTKAFDSWKQDFDSSMSRENVSLCYPSAKFDEENIFESRTVLHHLSHMAMHVDVVSCQIFAGAGRLLGRTTLQIDYDTAQRRIRHNWAPKASARHATFYALKFLTQVLMPNSSSTYGNLASFATYSARDDFLLNRPWVLYYAVLVVWSYGYALDGPIKNPPALLTPDEQKHDMKQYLARVGCIQAPPDLASMRDRNACLGLLYVLREKFQKCRWQLLHEAASLLGNCIEKLRGSG
ncbi:MAG: hypothetical protein Q9163_006021 [Psora crenata]